MLQVFISNIQVQVTETTEIITNDDFDISNFSVRDTTGYTVYVIDVHCSFNYGNRKLKYQEQGGVIIYRHLLKQFEKCQDKLKVIFYSPISKENLAALKPENYVLTLLPFVELHPATEQYGIKPEEWTFNKVLEKAEKENCPQFNNASENLLSGWALANKGEISKGKSPLKVQTNSKKILFIDDQQSEWKESFSHLFGINTIQYIKNNKGHDIESQGAYRTKLKSNWESFVSLTKKAVENNPDLILSDFYLEENHDITKWKDISEICKISGFKLFNELRLIAPSIPYTFHTSSNKASIYKFLDANGADDWMIKDIRVDSSKNEKEENYLEFKNCIEKFLCGYTYIQLNVIWKKIDKIDTDISLFWWNVAAYSKLKETITGVLKESWFGLRRAARKELLFEQAIYNSEIGSEDSFTATSVINSMSKILELLGFGNIRGTANGNSGLAVIVNSMRNIASHGRRDLNCFSIRDGILANQLLLELLQQTGSRNNLIKIFPKPNYTLYPTGSKESYKYALLWLYLQLYNSGYINKHLKSYTTLVEERIFEIFEIAKNDTGFLNTLNSVFNKYKVIDATIKTRAIRKDLSGKFEIVTKL